MSRSRIRLLLLPVAACVVTLCVGPSVPAAEFSLPISTWTLKNGLMIVMIPDSTVPTVSYQTAVNVGSRDETKPGATGLAHVFEHMMFRGTERYPDYDDAISHMGPQTNAWTGLDYTNYYINVKKEYLKDVIPIEADRIRNLVFTKEAFRTELGPVKEERRRGVVESPGGFLEVELYRLAFTTHTYHHPVIGWEEDLERNMTFEDGLEFKNTFYTPSYCRVIIAGNFDVDSARGWVQAAYGDWTGEPQAYGAIEREPKQTEAREADFVWKDPLAAPRIMMGFKTPETAAIKHFAVVKVIDRILFMESGRLTRALKHDRQMVEDLSSWVGMSKDPGLWTVTATVKKGESIADVEELMRFEFERLREDPVGEEELHKAIAAVKARMYYRLDRPFAVAAMVGNYLTTGGSLDILDFELEVLDRLTPGGVQFIAKRHLAPENTTTVRLRPKPTS